MVAPEHENESSMEDILASIRRIIDEDNNNHEKIPNEDLSKINPNKQKENFLETNKINNSDDDVLILTKEIVDLNEVKNYSEESGINSKVNNNFSPDDLLNILATDTAMKALKRLDIENQRNISKGSEDKITIEKNIIEILKPMLSKWLSDNLPEIVENLVQREIDRINNNRK
tara:strand:- start:40823 stop:41341 length:519 start_codon:yes stop_codon:yes gene_type:complete